MASPADCLEGFLHTVTGPGIGVYWQPAGTPDPIDDHLRSVTPSMTTPGRVTVFVRGDQVATGIDPALRVNLLRDAGLRAGLQVKVVDANGDPVADADVERSVANALDLPVTSTRWAVDRVGVDAAGQVTGDGTPSAYLVLPDAVNAQRRAAVDAMAGRFSSVDEFMRAAEPGAGPHSAWHTLGAYLTAIHSVGATVPPAVADLLRQPMITPNQVVEAIGGPEGPQPARPDALQSHLQRHPGNFALVVGGEQIHALVPAGDGSLQWLPAGRNTPVPFAVDGAVDPFTELLEQPGARVLVLDPNGVRQETPPLGREPAGRSPINPPTGTTAGPQDQTRIGMWPEQTTSRLGLDAVDLGGVPTIMVDARFAKDAKATDSHKDLEPRQITAVTNAGFRHYIRDSRPLVISTADTPQTRETAARSGGVAVYPTKVATGLDVTSLWSMHVPGAAEPIVLGEGRLLTQTMVNRALHELGEMPALDNRVPEVLRNLLSLNSYEEARDYWSANFTELRSPAVGDAIDRLAGSVPASDRWLNVMKLAHTIAQRTDSFQHGPRPIEPTVRNSIDAEAALPAGVTVDLQFVFDFLTGRGLAPLAPGTEAPGPYQTRLLWDGRLFRMMLDGALPAGDAMVLANGVHGDDHSRATMDPGMFDASDSHAALLAAIRLLVDNSLAALQRGADGKGMDIGWEELTAQLAKCRNGEDRLVWHFRLRDVLQPHLAAAGLLDLSAPALSRLRNLIYLCH